MEEKDAGGAAEERAIDWREVFGWAMFDFANSSFTTVIVTVAFSVYFTNVVAGGQSGDFLWSVASAIALLVVLLTSPLVGALADFSGAKKKFLFTTYLGCVFFTALLYFVKPGDVYLGMALFVFAKIFFSTGENLTAAFLPDIAPPSKMGQVSGGAWALGFLGGILCLVVATPFMGGLSDPTMVADTRMVPVVTAVFFLLAGIPTFAFLKERGSASELPEGETYFSVSFGRLRETMHQVSELTELVKFLAVFTVFNCGLSVVVYFTAIFAESEIGFTAGELTKFFILTNLVAAFGAFGFGVVQDKIGAKKAINLTLVIWMSATLLAYFSTSKASFWLVGVLAGSALGATQSGSRALIGEFSPPSRSAEFFGFWGLFWKLSEAIGPLVFGLISATAATESAGRRLGILATTLFFVVGFVGMFFIDHDKGVREAQAYEARTREAGEGEGGDPGSGPGAGDPPPPGDDEAGDPPGGSRDGAAPSASAAE